MHYNQVHKLWSRATDERDKAKKELNDLMQIMDDFLELYEYRDDFQEYLNFILSKSMITNHWPYRYKDMRTLHLRLRDKQ